MRWITFIIFFLQLLMPFIFLLIKTDNKYYRWSSDLTIGWMQFYLLSVIVGYAVDSIEK